MNVIVIGSGIAGLATAVRLAAAGHQVTVFEANTYVGGKLTSFVQDGYRFDAGPSLFTMPALVDELFTLCGKNPSEHFTYLRLTNLCNYFYEDGTRFNAYSNKHQFLNEVTEKLGAQHRKPVEKYLAKAAVKYQLAYPVFVEKSLHKASTYFNFKTLKSALQMGRLGLTKTLNRANEEAFAEPKLVKYFNRYATYNGSNPFRTSAVFSMIPHLEHELGAYFPEKGMYGITQAVYQLAIDMGVKFKLHTPVTRIGYTLSGKHKKVSGVYSSGEFYAADCVVSNSDIGPTYQRLLPELPMPKHVKFRDKSSSALIFYWGINRSFSELDLHNVFFSDDTKAEFKHIFGYHSVFYDPTIYINITSKLKPDDAPSGCENWFVMINVPYNKGQLWDLVAKEAKRNIIQKLNRILKTDLEPHIVTEQVLDPILIEQKTGSEAGSLYGTSSNDLFSAFYRHKNFSSDIQGLYFCGGSVHPGGGIPLCLNSAKIVAKLITND